MRQISAEKTRQLSPLTFAQTWDTHAHLWQDIWLQLMLCRRNYYTPTYQKETFAEPKLTEIELASVLFPKQNICRPSQDMVFFQITGDRVTITNYWISHNTCNTLLPRLIQTQQQSNTLDGWHTIYHMYHIYHLYHKYK